MHCIELNITKMIFVAIVKKTNWQLNSLVEISEISATIASTSCLQFLSNSFSNNLICIQQQDFVVFKVLR